MSTATTNGKTTTPETTTPKRGFPGIVCIKCQDPDAIVSLDLDHLENFHCNECNEDFGLEEVQEYIDRGRAWERVAAWIQLAPTVE